MADPTANTGEKRKRAAGKAMGDSYEAAKEQAKGIARDTLDELKSQTSAASEAAQRSVARLGDQMREAAESLLHEQQERVAEAVHGLAEALRQAAETLEREERDVAARYADQAAAQIDRLSETMRQRHLRDMLANAEDFARRQPALFIVGAVAIGFVVGRVLARPAERGRRTRRLEGYATTGGESRHHAAAYEPQGEATAGYGAGSKPEPS